MYCGIKNQTITTRKKSLKTYITQNTNIHKMKLKHIYITTVFLCIALGVSAQNTSDDVAEMSKKLPEYAQLPSDQEKKELFARMKADTLLPEDYVVIGKAKVKGVQYTSVYSNLKTVLVWMLALKDMKKNGMEKNQEILIYRDKSKTPNDKELKREHNRLNDVLIGAVVHDPNGKLLLRYFVKGIGFIDMK